jgi:O-methyltransferase involved in polyketide biosynthesis
MTRLAIILSEFRFQEVAMDSIAKTSLLTAAMRAVETQRSEEEGRLFSDPYADLLAGDE